MTLYYRCGRCHQVSLTWPVNTSAPWMRWCPRCTLPSSTHSSTRCTRTAPGQPNTPTITQWPIICPIYLIINLKDNFSKDNVVIFFQWMHTGILHVCCSLKKKNIYIEHIPLVIYFFNYVCFFCFTGNEIKRLFREFNLSFPDSIASKCFWLALSSLDWCEIKRHIWDLVKFSSQKCLYF